MVNLTPECSISTWHREFKKEALEAVVLNLPDDVLNYLEHDAFILPLEATNDQLSNGTEWSDGSPVDNDSSDGSEPQPTFPEFSKKIQDVIDDYGAVFIKTNWKTPLDATWVAPTRTLKCTSLDEVYLLLKSSDRISQDISAARQLVTDKSVFPCLVLKKWRDINPCTEFRCFVVDNNLMGISQRDISQYHPHIESEQNSIHQDIKSLFLEKIKNRFPLRTYTFDVIRYRKDKVKIIDFGLLDESTVENTLFTYAELNNSIEEPPEFRFIGENMGIQPSRRTHICVPVEINEFFRTAGDASVMDMIRREVENQRIE